MGKSMQGIRLVIYTKYLTLTRRGVLLIIKYFIFHKIFKPISQSDNLEEKTFYYLFNNCKNTKIDKD